MAVTTALLPAAAVALVLFVFCREIAPMRARDEHHASNPRSSRTAAGRVVRRAITWIVRNVMIAKTEIATLAKILLGFVQVSPRPCQPQSLGQNCIPSSQAATRGGADSL